MNNLAFQIYGSTKSGIFQSTWKTDNTSTGSSASNQITLPLLSGGTYNFWIDWGDGSTTNVTSYSQRTHTYASAGTYTLRATGTITGWGFQNTGDKLKILTITSWGRLKNLNQGFYGCSNLTLSGIIDVLDLNGTTSLGAMFSGCSNITTVGRMNEWDTSLVTNMSNMFVACVLFNQPLNNWNTGNVTTFQSMFSSCSSFNQCIGSWNVTKCTTFEGMFNACTNFNNGDNSVPLNNWVLNTTAASVSLNYIFLSCIKFNRYIGDWNTSKVTIMASVFSNCTIFNNGYASGIANQLPWNTSSCITMSGMFQSASSFNSNLGNGTTPWDVSKVTTFANMFGSATKFNNGDDTAPINNWNVGGDASVTTISMSSMFSSASVFNRPVDNWNMTKVNAANSMFQNAILFNQPLSNWERTGSTMGNITTMYYMFATATVFNQDISNWDISKVISFHQMFYLANAFNNNTNTTLNIVTGRTGLNGWNIGSNVSVPSIDMIGMFASTAVFNRDISSWNMNKVVSIQQMFNATIKFNQPLDSWDVSNVTNTLGMFENAAVFNQPIDSWNVSNVKDMSYMFNQSLLFNQSLSNWERVGSSLSKVTNMNSMFKAATAFNQNIGNWNVSQVANFTNFMLAKTATTFSSTNLDAIYNGWIVNGVTPNINISFGTAKYTSAGATGRAILTSSPNNWTITDGGL